jgi:hypothetical protein
VLSACGVVMVNGVALSGSQYIVAILSRQSESVEGGIGARGSAGGERRLSGDGIECGG